MSTNKFLSKYYSLCTVILFNIHCLQYVSRFIVSLGPVDWGIELSIFTQSFVPCSMLYLSIMGVYSAKKIKRYLGCLKGEIFAPFIHTGIELQIVVALGLRL